MNNRQSDNSKLAPNKGAMRYVALVFLVLAITLLVISIYSFMVARSVQQNYNSMVLDSLSKLELINSLHNNEDLIYDKVVQHLKSVNPDSMQLLEQEIAQADQEVRADLERLNKLLTIPGRREMLYKYTLNREAYQAHLQELMALSRKYHNSDISETEEAEKLAPAYREHQQYLNRLSDSISVTTRRVGTEALQEIDKTVRNYNLLMLAALLITGVTGYLVRGVIKQLRQHRQILNTEIREREQLRSAYNQSQVIYRSLFQNIALPMVVFDVPTKRVIDVNKAAISEYGYTREEFLGLNIEALQPEHQKERFHKFMLDLPETLITFPDWQHKRKDGSKFYVDIKAHSLPLQDGMQPRIAVVINIDEQIKALQELGRREKQFHEISSSIPGAVYQFQLDKDYNVSFPFISEGIGKLYGLTPEDVQKDPNNFFDLVHPDDKQKLWDSIQVSYQHLEPWEQEFRTLNKKSDSYIWLKGTSLPTSKGDGVVIWNGTLIDITNEIVAQEKLIASEANLRYLLNSSPQAIYLLDATMRVVAFNTQAAEEVRQSQLKMLKTGTSILSYIAPAQQKRTLECHHKALAGETIVYETNSAGIWHEVAFRPVVSQEHEVLAVALSILDITEQKNIIGTLQHNETQLKRAQELSNMGYWEYDIVMGKITWSEQLYKIYGVTPDTFIPHATSVLELVHPDDKETVLNSYQQARKTGETVKLEHRVITPAGEERIIIHIGEIFFDEYKQPIRMSGTIQDITASKLAEREIIETKNLLQSTLANIPEIIFSTDSEFRITYISPQCLDILGYTTNELTGNADLWVKNIYHEDLPLMWDVMKRIMLGEKVQYELRVMRSDQAIRWLLLRLSPTLNQDGSFNRLDGSAADITQRKQAEAKREELNTQLMTQNRNLQQFAYIVSHNLRAPIANILGLTSIYDRKNPNAPINQRVIENMAKSAKLLDSTIRDLNELLSVRNEQLTGLMEKVYFETVMQHVTDSLSDELQVADATLTTDFADAPVVYTVKSYLLSILHNLVSNAIKYRHPDRKLNVIVRSFVTDDYICLQVSDNGLGIDIEKERDKLFGLYKRFHPTIAGKGLGLHLVKTQAELLGGKVDVESTLDVGTTFCVYFVRSTIINERFKESNVD